MTLHVLVRTLGIHGGTERFTHGFVHWAVQNGHSICVHSVRVENPIDGITHQPIPIYTRGRFLKMAELDYRLQQRAKELHDPQICMVRGGASPIYRAGGGCHAHWMAKRPWTVGDALERHIDQRVCHHAQTIVVNSQRSISLLDRHYGIDPRKCILLRNGVDIMHFTNKGDRERPHAPTMIFVGHDFRRKGLDITLKWLQLLPEWCLWVMGSDPNARYYQRLAEAMGVHQRVRWLGRVDEPAYWLRSATVCVLPTRYDPAANVCLEALACGTPVVTSTENGASELLWEDWMIRDLKQSDGIIDVFSHLLEVHSDLSNHARTVAMQHTASKCYEKLWAIGLQTGEA